MKTSSEVTELVFQNELTEKGLADLRARFPADLVADMSNKEEFKAARKVRTERNKLNEAINQRRLDVTKELKDHGDGLMVTVSEIFSVIVEPFETENKRLKEIEAEEKRKLEKLLAEQRAEISGIRQFLTDANTATSEQISGMVDAVGNIEASSFHKELVHEAIAVIDEVKLTLADMLLKQIESERLQEEAIALEALAKEAQAKADRIQKEADEKAEKLFAEAEELRLENEAREQEAEKLRELTERINKLRMIPMDVMGEPSGVIKKKITSIGNVQINEESFLTHVAEAEETRCKVLEQLDSMLKQAEQIEALTPAESPVVEQAAEVVQAVAGNTIVTDQAIHVDTQVVTEAPPFDRVTSSAAEVATPRTIWTDVDAWASKYSISANAYNELGAIINQYV